VSDSALPVAALALVVSATSLAWQMSQYRLNGSRIRAQLQQVIMTQIAFVIAEASKCFSAKSPPRLGDGDVWAELALLTVWNEGRTVVWVSDFGLDFGSPWWLRARHRTTMSTHPVAVLDGIPTNTPTRLEPGHSVKIVFRVQDSSRWASQQHPKSRLLVRGRAKGGGRRSISTPRRTAWEVQNGNSGSFVPFLTTTKQVLVYQALVDYWPDSDVTHLYSTWLDVWNALEHPTNHTVFDPIRSLTRLSLEDALDEVPGLSVMSQTLLIWKLRELYSSSSTYALGQNPSKKSCGL
jgi:hypothetical protein